MCTRGDSKGEIEGHSNTGVIFSVEEVELNLQLQAIPCSNWSE